MTLLLRFLGRFFRPRVRLVIGLSLLVGGAIGWPITALTIFRSEQQGILALSWLALIYSGYITVGESMTAIEQEDANR